MRCGTSSKTFSLNGVPVTELVIPDTATSIPSYAFAGTNITSIIIGNSVTSIGQSAFSGCSSLTSIIIPFVGASKDGRAILTSVYIFGASSAQGNYDGNKNRYINGNADCVPSSLKTVEITGKQNRR